MFDPLVFYLTGPSSSLPTFVHSHLPDERTSGKLYLSIASVQNPPTVLTFAPLSRIRQASPNEYP
ncbi:hypothetical protein T05_11444 [Trichinella murrelli]|uniref:Uncharacterized protein n=1 Tax=Trichinella murrelli TaxID=144512 RepID=A0A0V0TT07_9BILA|nr:hypothetical protein T05_11444 [Trichinella murrelli]